MGYKHSKNPGDGYLESRDEVEAPATEAGAPVTEVDAPAAEAGAGDYDPAVSLLDELLKAMNAENVMGVGSATEADSGDAGDNTESDEETDDEDDYIDELFLVEAPRKYHIWPVFITTITLFILLTGGLTFFNRTVMAAQAEEQAAIRKHGDELLNESLAYIQEADKVVVALDKATDSQIAEGDIPKLEALLDQIDSTEKCLDSALSKAREAQETYVDKNGKALAQYAIDAVGYRRQMLAMSSQLTRYDIDALGCALSLEYAWNLIVEADANMRYAVEIVAANGGGAVSESRDYNQEALEKLHLAQEVLAITPSLFPGVDVKVLNDYLVVKIQSVELAIASDDAYLVRNYLLATEKNDEFRAKDLEAVELAAKIPSNPMSLMIAAYNEATRQLKEDYKDVRLMAVDTDAYLRAYLNGGA